jgi:hypothetical protein
MIYFACVHSIMSYGIIFWGNSTYGNLIFKIQKRIVRINIKERNNAACHLLFGQLNILLLHSQYLYSLSMLVTKNLNIYRFNTAIHSTSIRQGSQLQFPSNKLAKMQKGVYYSEIRILNNLPQSIRNFLCDVIKFKQPQKSFLLFVHFIP